ncbi:hypothetical protein [Desulforhopalus sp. IMCC35007]|uniref:hypothetical protein n=1 Tax=Desulforhopalus sp. IMCC35007 TaxID=2569543 RepID=UPI00145D5E17|nr:hypothetical protein [Desulforhopalus sp. IMCC35007]
MVQKDGTGCNRPDCGNTQVEQQKNGANTSPTRPGRGLGQGGGVGRRDGSGGGKGRGGGGCGGRRNSK